MPVFDPRQQRMCVRVVYDGVAATGKTTNLRHLCNLFGAQRAVELHTPAEIRGRTLYFDWLQINAGVVSGFPLICQVISVPGQVVLTPRRRHLLASADVVVYVCDSRASALSRGAEGLVVLDEEIRRRSDPPPLVLQANKQDFADALDGPALLEALGREKIPVVEAIATDAVGVMDTFVTAVRAVARSIEQRSERRSLLIDVRAAETPGRALERLAREEIDKEWAAEMFLEELTAALTIGEATSGQASGLVIDRPDAPAGAGSTARDDTAVAAPRLPGPDVPAGFIWPAHTGRAALRALTAQGALTGEAALEPNGSVTTVLATHVLSTSHANRFDDIELARQALVRSARARTQLGALLAPDTVLVVQAASDGASWLWIVVRKLVPISEALQATGSGRPRTAAVSESLGAAAARALELVFRAGLGLRIDPEAFGMHDGVVRYLGSIESIPSANATGAALVEAVCRVTALGGDADAYVDALEQGLATRLASDDVERLWVGVRDSVARADAGGARSGVDTRLAAVELLERALGRIARAA